jgi:hypothetical protein
MRRPLVQIPGQTAAEGQADSPNPMIMSYLPATKANEDERLFAIPHAGRSQNALVRGLI